MTVETLSHAQKDTLKDTLKDTAHILAALGLDAENHGAFDGTWIHTHGERVESLNPATGEPIAAVRLATAEDYERVAAVSAEAFRAGGPGRRRAAARSSARSATSCASTRTSWAAWSPSKSARSSPRARAKCRR